MALQLGELRAMNALGLDTTCSHERAHPLLLPDILILLGSFLSTKDLFQAILVCRCWYSALVPQLWNTIHVGGARRRDKGRLYSLDRLEILEQHLQFIRSFELAFEQCPSTQREKKDPGATAVEKRFTTILTGCQ